jgi:hypothetical protein
MVEIVKLGVLALVGGVFLYGLKKDWDGVYIIFGLVFLLGSCQMLGVK